MKEKKMKQVMELTYKKGIKRIGGYLHVMIKNIIIFIFRPQ